MDWTNLFDASPCVVAVTNGATAIWSGILGKNQQSPIFAGMGGNAELMQVSIDSNGEVTLAWMDSATVKRDKYMVTVTPSDPRVLLYGCRARQLSAYIGAVDQLGAKAVIDSPGDGVALTFSGSVPGTLSLSPDPADMTGIPGALLIGVNMGTRGALQLSGTYASGLVSFAYSSDLTISGGSGSYLNPRTTSGSLPPGTSLSIVSNLLRLSGTPTASGTYAFTAAVDSTDAQTATSPQSVVMVDPMQWNPYDKSVSVALSNNNLTATGNWSVRATYPKTTGKFYFEIHNDVVNTNTATCVGVASANMDLTSGQLGLTAPTSESIGFRFDGQYLHSGNFSGPIGAQWYQAGKVVMIAVDVDHGLIWFGVDGAWTFSGNPATSTNGLGFTVNGAVYAACTVGGAASFTARFRLADQSYAPPTGFSAWGI